MYMSESSLSTYLFVTQVSISCSSLVFAMMMLYIGNDPGIYLPIITGIIGCWLPSPQHAVSRSLKNKAPERQETISRYQDIEQPLLTH
jgi:hypothetical protein